MLPPFRPGNIDLVTVHTVARYVTRDMSQMIWQDTDNLAPIIALYVATVLPWCEVCTLTAHTLVSDLPDTISLHCTSPYNAPVGKLISISYILTSRHKPILDEDGQDDLEL